MTVNDLKTYKYLQVIVERSSEFYLFYLTSSEVLEILLTCTKNTPFVIFNSVKKAPVFHSFLPRYEKFYITKTSRLDSSSHYFASTLWCCLKPHHRGEPRGRMFSFIQTHHFDLLVMAMTRNR
ncbi:hypothetical protein PM082_024369 [Marasmius tenuissimus]|nr:hypothetical protein PM082_024369 [Marasmius tenuissimus]